jgi:2-(1,2-epoxy-1,2-dihydrophenyl)acetyl-CoA isomerase
VTRLWPVADFDVELATLARTLAHGPTVAYGIAKRLLNRTFETDLSTALELESLGQSITSGSVDHRRSIEAFADKTETVFEGR